MLSDIVTATDGLMLSATAATATEVTPLIKQYEPQLLIMENCLPLAQDGIELCGQLRQSHPHIGIIVIGNSTQKPLMRQVWDAGPHAYLIKHKAEEEDIKLAIRQVLAGGTHYCKEFTPLLTGDKKRRVISEEQRELIRMICMGIKSISIAGVFCRSSHAIDKRRAKLMKDLGVTNIIELIQLALSEGIIDWSHLFE